MTYNQIVPRQWKSIVLDYDNLVSVEGSDCRIHAISEVTRQICLAFLEMANWQTRYYSTIGTAISKDKIEAWTAEAMCELMCEPITCRDLQQVIDQVNSQITLQQKTSGEIIYNDIDNNYLGTTVSIAPDAVYDATGDDAYRDTALCYALWSLIESTLDAIATDKENADKELVMMAAAVVTLGIVLAPFTAGLSALLATAISGGIGLVAQAYLSVINEAELRDETAREELLCFAYEKLEGATMERVDLEAAFSGASALSATAQKQADIMNAVCGSLGVYFGMASLLQEGFSAAENGLLSDPCVGCGACGDWEETFNFEDSAHSFVNSDISPAVSGDQFFGTWVTDEGWRESIVNYGDSAQGVWVTRTFDDRVINRLILAYSSTKGLFDSGSAIAARVMLLLNNVVVYDSYIGAEGTFGDDLELVKQTGGVTADQVLIGGTVSHMDTDGEAGDGYMKLPWLRICGDGVNPF